MLYKINLYDVLEFLLDQEVGRHTRVEFLNVLSNKQHAVPVDPRELDIPMLQFLFPHISDFFLREKSMFDSKECLWLHEYILVAIAEYTNRQLNEPASFTSWFMTIGDHAHVAYDKEKKEYLIGRTNADILFDDVITPEQIKSMPFWCTMTIRRMLDQQTYMYRSIVMSNCMYRAVQSIATRKLEKPKPSKLIKKLLDIKLDHDDKIFFDTTDSSAMIRDWTKTCFNIFYKYIYQEGKYNE